LVGLLQRRRCCMRRPLLYYLVVLTAMAGLFLAAGPALAQGGPGLPENHYKVYEVPPVPGPGQITLTDQFGTIEVPSITLEKFAIPAEKHLLDGSGEIYPIYDSRLHYTWWRFDVATSVVRRVEALDQFGGYSWRLRDPVYLLCPAGKNDPTIPFANHYECYQADDAPVVNISVKLVDQVDSVVVAVLHGEYFCNPVEKTFEGNTYEMVDPLLHMTCYRVDNLTPYAVSEIVYDQFGDWALELEENTYLCLPAEKGNVVPGEPTSWGRIKALYR